MFKRYIIRRVLTTLIIFFAIINFQFLLFWVFNPIKPVQWIIDPDFMSPGLIESLKRLYGLDQPLHVQYYKYIVNMLTFNFGVSFRLQRPVVEMLFEYLPNTIVLVLTAQILQIIIGVMTGLIIASKRGKIVDFSVMGAGLVIHAVPAFLVMLVFRYVFAEKLRLFPILTKVVTAPDNPLMFLGNFMYRMSLPLITLVCIGFGTWLYYTRNLSIGVLTQDFIQTARAKGVSDRGLVFGHILPAILPPIVTLVIVTLPTSIFGSIMAEYIFSWKGIGWWYLNSIWGGDYPAVQALFYIYTVLLLTGNLLADILYGYMDPRIRIEARR